MKSSTSKNAVLLRSMFGTALVAFLGLTVFLQEESLNRVDEHPSLIQPVEVALPVEGIDEAHPSLAFAGEEISSREIESFSNVQRLHFESHEFDPATVIEWREKPGSDGLMVEGILEYGDRGLVYFDAERTGSEQWEIRKSAFLGEYVIQNDYLPMEEWKALGYLDSGLIEISSTNRVCSHVKIDVETLDQMDFANGLVISDLPEAVADMNAIVYPVATPNDPEYPGSWTLAKLNTEPVWEAYGFSPEAALGRRAVIAVIDNGASETNPDWHMWINEGEIAGNGVDDDGNGYIDDVSGYNFARYNGDLSYAGGHGSMVSKISASLSNNGIKTASPASSASLMRVLYYEDSLGGHYAAISAILYALENGADVVNCSFISTSSSMFGTVFNAAREKNASIVAGAGNSKRDLDTSNPLYPVTLDDEVLIGVGASTSSDELGASNYSVTDIDVMAPGSATSYTTPLVTSTVALLRSIKPDATYGEIRQAIIDGADVFPALAGLCVSGGRLNVGGAVEALLGGSLPGNDNPDPVSPVPVISISSVGETTVQLTWSTSAPVDSFEVEFSEANGGYLPLEPSAMFLGNVSGTTVENLLSGTSYQFRIRSLTNGTTSNWAQSLVVTTNTNLPVAPIVPSINVESIGIGSVTLSWNTNEAVDSFELKASADGNPYESIPGAESFAGNESGVELTGLGEGVSYRFRIRAVRDGVASDWKNSSLATTLEPAPVAPAAPEIVIAGVGVGSVDLTWGTGEAVNSFEVQMSESGGAYAALSGGGVFAGNESGVELTGLGEGVSYRFRIRAVREGLSSTWTVSAVATTLEPAPVAPAAPEIVIAGVGVGSVDLTWGTGEAVNSFEVQMSESGGAYAALSGGGVFAGNESGVELTGLGEGVSYRFRIRAVREGLSSTWTVSAVATTLEPAPVAPAAPEIVIAGVGVGSVDLTWGTGEAVNSFEVQMSESGGAYAALSGGGIFAGNESGVELTGLGEGVSYRFRIRAVREGLSSTWTVSALATTLEPAPVAPAAPEIVIAGVGVGSVDLTWGTGEAVNSFEVQMSESGGAYAALSGGGVFAGNESGVELTGLGEGVSYRFRIRAIREGLSSTWTVSALATTLEPAPVEIAPSWPSITIESEGPGTVTLSWSVSEVVDGFELEASEAGNFYAPIPGYSFFAGDVTGVQITGLGYGVSYRFQIRAIRGELSSSWKKSKLATTTEASEVFLSIPSLVVDSIGIGSVDLVWAATETVDGFELQMSESGAEFVDVELSEPITGLETGLQLLGLKEGVNYAFRIRSVKEGMTSDWGLSPTIKTLEPAPEAPLAPILTATVFDKTSVNLSWETIDSVEGFELQVSEGGMAFEAVQEGLVLSANDTSLMIQDLLEATDYQFRIRAVRSGLVSAWKESSILRTGSMPWPKAQHNWKFNNGSEPIAYDSGSLALNLELDSQSGTSWGDGIGTLQTGLEFSGSHKGVEVPDSDAINLTNQEAFTLSMWVKTSGDSSRKTAVLYEQGGFWRGLNLIIDEGWLFASGWNRPVKESDWAGTTLPGGELIPGQWTHVVLVLNAAETIQENGLTLYVNGQAVASGPASMLWANMEKTGIGQVQGGTVYRNREVRRLDPFQGTVDEMNIWCCALTPEEITEIYESASAN